MILDIIPENPEKSDNIGEEKREKTRQLAILINDIRHNNCQLVLELGILYHSFFIELYARLKVQINTPKISG